MPRLGVLDQARILAALAVIWIHTPETPALATTTTLVRFAVPFFACTAGYFAATGPVTRLLPDLARRSRRLYSAFLAWSLLYLAVRCVAPLALGARGELSVVTLPPLLDFLTAGPVHHLWFLPFAILVSFLATLVRLLPAGSTPTALVLLALSTLITFLPRPGPELPAGYLLALTRDHLPAALTGIVLGLVTSHRDRTQAALGRFVLPALAVAGACAVSQAHFGRQILVENLYGFALFVAAMGAPARGGARVLALSKATLGVYLVHVLFVEGLQDVLHGVLHLPESAGLDLSVFALTTGSSFAVALLLLRSVRTRWLVS